MDGAKGSAIISDAMHANTANAAKQVYNYLMN